MENIVKMIVKKYGGYREKEIMRYSHTIERAETWNTEHKVLNVLDAVPDADGYFPVNLWINISARFPLKKPYSMNIL